MDAFVIIAKVVGTTCFIALMGMWAGHSWTQRRRKLMESLHLVEPTVRKPAD